MDRLAFLADVHVKRAYVSAVRSSGYRMVWQDNDAYDHSIEDEELLDWGLRDGLLTTSHD